MYLQLALVTAYFVLVECYATPELRDVGGASEAAKLTDYLSEERKHFISDDGTQNYQFVPNHFENRQVTTVTQTMYNVVAVTRTISTQLPQTVPDLGPRRETVTVSKCATEVRLPFTVVVTRTVTAQPETVYLKVGDFGTTTLTVSKPVQRPLHPQYYAGQSGYSYLEPSTKLTHGRGKRAVLDRDDFPELYAFPESMPYTVTTNSDGDVAIVFSTQTVVATTTVFSTGYN